MMNEANATELRDRAAALKAEADALENQADLHWPRIRTTPLATLLCRIELCSRRNMIEDVDACTAEIARRFEVLSTPTK